ncbi:transcriptional repressor BetI (plasmid) [Variovorax sp. PBS-H4]|uniref:TetR/AcrR family transcriptional regulator n=1 Tax=Variovorax sp. PBS-H4 TaxID=434008 RepID=UPI001317F5D8|nr:TetR/AcrR family transcriptional regulator [Variovorax sp. PBS-H4]VTU41483.1 transcriptional repressor BetI [Variovorax sp. PBS-H4]
MADKRSDIVGAAMALVQEEGLSGLTQPRVAKRLELRQSHVTYYFPTRDDLLAAVTEQAVQQRVAALNTVRSPRTLPRKIAALAAVLIDPAQTRVLLALTQIADSTPTLRPHFRSLSGGIAPAATSLLQAAGADPTPEAIALLQTTSTGMAVVALATGQSDPAPLIALLTDLLASLPRSRKEQP